MKADFAAMSLFFHTKDQHVPNKNTYKFVTNKYRSTLSSIEYNANEILYFLYTVPVHGYNLNQNIQLLFIYFYKFSCCLDKTIYQ